jgi:hypothetical protein
LGVSGSGMAFVFRAIEVVAERWTAVTPTGWLEIA